MSAAADSAGACQHGHAAAEPDRSGKLFAALAVTSVTLVAEAVGGWWSGSLALLSDAGHMLGDVLALSVSLVAMRLAARPASKDFPFGLQRVEVLAAAFNALLSVVLAVVLAVEARERWLEPSPIALGPMAVIAAIGLASNAISVRLLHGSHDLNVRSAWLHVMGDLLSSVAVLVGAAGMALTGEWRLDPLLSAGVGLLIGAGGLRLLKDAVWVLLEAAPASPTIEEVQASIHAVPGVTGSRNVRLWTLSGSQIALEADVATASRDLEAFRQVAHAIRHRLEADFGIEEVTLEPAPPQMGEAKPNG